jgi:hypothetical protein
LLFFLFSFSIVVFVIVFVVLLCFVVHHQCLVVCYFVALTITPHFFRTLLFLKSCLALLTLHLVILIPCCTLLLHLVFLTSCLVTHIVLLFVPCCSQNCAWLLTPCCPTIALFTPCYSWSRTLLFSHHTLLLLHLVVHYLIALHYHTLRCSHRVLLLLTCDRALLLCHRTLLLCLTSCCALRNKYQILT